MLLSIALAMLEGDVVAAMATERISFASTLILLTEVLLVPLIEISLVRGEGIRG